MLSLDFGYDSFLTVLYLVCAILPWRENVQDRPESLRLGPTWACGNPLELLPEAAV
jgi:hypothetical protein